jgi:uncharacterized protein YodC (DUF2158 family)
VGVSSPEMRNSKFNVGDIVNLKSGEPRDDRRSRWWSGYFVRVVSGAEVERGKFSEDNTGEDEYQLGAAIQATGLDM